MTKRRAQSFVFWLLPILVLRALMPVGTMLDVSGGRTTVVMCSEGFAKAATPSGDASTTRGQVTQHGDQHSVCPFAMALGATAPVEVAIVVHSSSVSTTLDHGVAVHHSPSGPSRIHSNRGPPAYS